MASENPNVARIRGISDPLSRAQQAHEFLINGRRTLEAMQHVRDDAIRGAHGAGRGTIDQIAGAIGAKRNVVVDALRRREEQR